MTDFNLYVSTDGRMGGVTVEELDAMLARWEWFSTARVVREHITGRSNGVVRMLAAGRGVSSLKKIALDAGVAAKAAPTAAEGAPSMDEILDKFLSMDNYRIVAQDVDDGDEGEVLTEARLDDEDDVVSEELAEVYLSQGFAAQAAAIYRKLSLLNPEKSVYFAEIIDRIEKNN